MTGALVERDEAQQNAPRRASQKDGIQDNGSTITIRVQGESFELTDRQLEEAANRFSLEATLTKKLAIPGIAADQLRSIIERIELLEEEKAGLASDIKDIFAEAKGNGYDVATLKKVLKLRTMDASERNEAEHLLDTYCVALRMKPQMEMFEE